MNCAWAFLALRLLSPLQKIEGGCGVRAENKSVEWYPVNGSLGGARFAPGQEDILKDIS
jgi:hypothetical protein